MVGGSEEKRAQEGYMSTQPFVPQSDMLNDRQSAKFRLVGISCLEATDFSDSRLLWTWTGGAVLQGGE